MFTVTPNRCKTCSICHYVNVIFANFHFLGEWCFCFCWREGGVIHDSWCLKAINSVEGSPDKHRSPCLSRPKKSPYPHVGTRYLQFRYLKTNKSTHLVGGFNHFLPHDIWDNPSHLLIFFKMVIAPPTST